MIKQPVHIRQKKPVVGDIRCKTLCGQLLHNQRIKTIGKFRIDKKVNGHWDMMHRVHSITEADANNMDGSVVRKRGRSSKILPPVEGPSVLRIPECDWCPDCFDHPKRALQMLARTDL